MKLPLLLLALLAALRLGAETLPPVQTRTIPLVAGWNSVWLDIEPDPAANAPETLLAGSTVDIAATYLTPVTATQFIVSPDEKPWNQPGWLVWFAPTRPDAFTSTLGHLRGAQAYLLHSTAPGTLTLTGTPILHRCRWIPTSYNLTGFPVDPDIPLTFTRFFAGSTAHNPLKILKLADNIWTPVTSADTIRPNTAYWVWCASGSDFQGPLSIPASSPALDFTTATATAVREILLRNGGTAPLPVKLRLNGAFPLNWRRTTLSATTATVEYLPLPSPLELTIPAASAIGLPLVPRLETSTVAPLAATLEIRDNQGILLRLPVRLNK